MVEFLKGIVDTLSTILSFVINIFTSLISLIGAIPSYLKFIIDSLNVLPTFILPFALAYISIIVVQYILNRKGS